MGIDSCKPAEICLAPERSAQPLRSTTSLETAEDFAALWQRQIAARLARTGLAVRRGTLDDLAVVDRLHRLCRPRLGAAQRPSELTFYRLLRFGLPVLVDDDTGRLVAYNLVQIVADTERTALSAGIAVHPGMAGRGLGRELARYTSLAAMAAGARVRRGTVHPANGASLKLFLNHLGAVCDAYFPNLAGPGEDRLEYALKLTPEALTRNAVDEIRLARYVAQGREGRDFRLLAAAASDALEELYRTRHFRVVAFARAGLVDPRPWLVALPVDHHGLKSKEAA